MDPVTVKRDVAMIEDARQNSTNFYLLIATQVLHVCVFLWMLFAFPWLLQPSVGTLRAVASGWVLIGVKFLLGSACVWASAVTEKEDCDDEDWVVLDESKKMD